MRDPIVPIWKIRSRIFSGMGWTHSAIVKTMLPPFIGGKGNRFAAAIFDAIIPMQAINELSFRNS